MTMQENTQLSPTLSRIQSVFGTHVVSMHSHRGDDTAVIDRAKIFDVLKFLRDDPGMAFNFMMDVTAVDYPDRALRFEVVYHLYSLSKNKRLRIKAGVPESDPTIASCVSLWIGADWFEREAYDLYGVIFVGHPNLKRILMYDGFEGHPLRKDYAVTKRQPLVVSLAQEAGKS